MGPTLRQTIAIGLLAQLLAPGLARAVQVLHHGLAVESEAGYVECLACHDNVIARTVPTCLATVCLFRGPHPVARPYPPPEKSEQFATPAEAERAGIRFVNGRIDCISCHNLQVAEGAHLRLQTAGSRLCFACHRK